jgi:hypothetical protein
VITEGAAPLTCAGVCFAEPGPCKVTPEGRGYNAGHTATVFHPGGGEFANVCVELGRAIKRD